MRGLIGRSLTPVVAARYAAAVGNYFQQLRGSGGANPEGSGSSRSGAHVVLGRDSRPSGEMIEAAAAAGLVAAGCRVTILGIVTTPSVAVMAEHLKADGGMVITASHNPIIWNGIKTLRHDGVAPPANEAKQIIDRFKSDVPEAISYAPVEQLQKIQRDDTTHRVHVDRVMQHIDAPAIRKGRKIKVVLDSVHGAGGPAAALLLRQLGPAVELIHLYGEPTGLFPHTPEPTRENLVGLCEAVKKHGADVGFAQDPDADRLAIVDETGAYIGEEYTLALTAMHVLARESKSPSAGAAQRPPSSAPVVVANLSTSRMLDDIAAAAGARVIRTPVGEANVAEAMRRENALIGGEGNGGVIWPKVIHVRDSIAGIALVLEMLARRGEPLSKIAASIPRYTIVKDKVDIKPGMAEKIAPMLKQRWPSERIDSQDGVRVDWPGSGAAAGKWVHVRPSNTEPILRIIAEAGDEATARATIAEVRQAMGL